MINQNNILETIHMIDEEDLDIRTITMGISLFDCVGGTIEETCANVYDKITSYASNLVKTADDIAKETGIPMVVTNDSHYINKEDWEAHDILLCIQTGKTVNDEDRMRYEKGQFYLKSPEEMEALFPYAKEALENTNKIAEMCNVDIVFGERKLPKYDVPDGYDSFSYLKMLCEKEVVNRYPEVTEEISNRLQYELDMIRQMGFVDYFLIVWDFVNFAKKQGIPVGPGRGSAAGSIVSYCLHITDVEPIHDGLLFERFLNP